MVLYVAEMVDHHRCVINKIAAHNTVKEASTSSCAVKFYFSRGHEQSTAPENHAQLEETRHVLTHKHTVRTGPIWHTPLWLIFKHRYIAVVYVVTVEFIYLITQSAGS